MAEAFFEPDDDGYLATELTRGPWDPDAQHAGPPGALIAREVERLEGGEERRIGRITVEILRSVPIGRLAVEARIVRPGRSVELVEATLSDARGEVMLARAWRLRAAPVDVPAEASSTGATDVASGSLATLRPGLAPPGPPSGEPKEFFPTGADAGYHTAMEYRFVAGAFLEPGPATTWMRMRVPLVEGEEPSPVQRVLVAADAGNGVSATLDWSRYLFINVDLSVHLVRPPAGEWVCLDAITIPEPSGIGIADTALFDELGPIGRAAQTLLVADRSAPA